MLFFKNAPFHGDENELINEIKNGSNELFVYLADKYRGRITAAAASFGLRESERDDLIQEGYIALYSAALAYESNRGASFSTFASHCIRNKMINWIDKNINSDASSLPLSSVDDSSLSKNGIVENDFENSIILKSELNELLHIADSLLSDFEKQIFSLYIKGYTNSEICETLSISRKSCDNALFRIRRKLKDAKSNT